MPHKERPFIAKGHEIRCLHDETATAILRPIRPQPVEGWRVTTVDHIHYMGEVDGRMAWDQEVECPYGEIGDRLWVKESWNHGTSLGSPKAKGIATYVVPAGCEDVDIYRLKPGTPAEAFGWAWSWKGKPRSKMPRWASRTLLEIKDIQAVRMCDITDQQARAAGAYEVPNEVMQDAARKAAAEGRGTVDGRDYLRYLFLDTSSVWEPDECVWFVEVDRLEG